jgi:leukotriene-A4 hydrolase
MGPESPTLGRPLIISSISAYKKGNPIVLLITYETTKSSQAVQWIEKESTMTKVAPFMYTQCQAANCRSLLPCQDSPSKKVTIDISLTVSKPLLALYSGIQTKTIDNGSTLTYFYKQDIKVPTYLIAIAVGNLAGLKISPRTTVYAENDPVFLEKCSQEFSDTEEYIKLAESYIQVPYQWGQYNLLVMPPSFPYGGMENPTLTFVTPSLVVGDKSLVYVISHEISHSWTGNLVTNANWENFWLNEGFTTFLQRKISMLKYGTDMALLEAQIGQDSLDGDIGKLGVDHSFTSLQPEIGAVTLNINLIG